MLEITSNGRIKASKQIKLFNFFEFRNWCGLSYQNAMYIFWIYYFNTFLCHHQIYALHFNWNFNISQITKHIKYTILLTSDWFALDTHFAIMIAPAQKKKFLTRVIKIQSQKDKPQVATLLPENLLYSWAEWDGKYFSLTYTKALFSKLDVFCSDVGIWESLGIFSLI